MNSTHVVCQIALGAMEKEKAGKELRMNQVGGGVLLFRKDWSRKTCLYVDIWAEACRKWRQEPCKYLGKEPPGDVKQGQGSPGTACLMHLQDPWGGHYGWNGVGRERMVGPEIRGLTKGEGRGQKAEGRRQRAGVYAGLWVTLLSVGSEPEDLLGCPWGALMVPSPCPLICLLRSSEHQIWQNLHTCFSIWVLMWVTRSPDNLGLLPFRHLPWCM